MRIVWQCEKLDDLMKFMRNDERGDTKRRDRGRSAHWEVDSSKLRR